LIADDEIEFESTELLKIAQLKGKHDEV
jgi:hypothetical protein